MPITHTTNFTDILSHLEYPQDYFIREGFQDGDPLYYGLDEGYAGLAGTPEASKIISAPLLVAQFNDNRTIITIAIAKDTQTGFTVQEDAKTISLVKKYIVFKSLTERKEQSDEF